MTAMSAAMIALTADDKMKEIKAMAPVEDKTT
jgi:hypothetical protein